jgi:hypothetical protein
VEAEENKIVTEEDSDSESEDFGTVAILYIINNI